VSLEIVCPAGMTGFSPALETEKDETFSIWAVNGRSGAVYDFGRIVMLGRAFPMALWLRERASERPGLLREFLDAAQAWRARGAHLDLARIVRQVDPSLVDPETSMPRGDVHGLYQQRFGIHFFQDVIEQLEPLSTTQGAIALASQLGLEPWYVWAHVAPRRAERDPLDPLDLEVPREVIVRMGDWAIGLQLMDVVAPQVCGDLVGDDTLSPRELAVWPITLALRHRIPHPLILPERERDEFIDAVAAWHHGAETDDFLIEAMSLAWVDRFGEPPRSPARASLPGPWHPLHWPEALDPADAVLWELLRHGVGLVEGWQQDVPALLTADELRTAWERSSAALDGLLATSYARHVARRLGIACVLGGELPDDTVGAAWRLLVFEGVLRELVGAIRALVLDPDAWLGEYDALAEQFDTWTRYGMRQFGNIGQG